MSFILPGDPIPKKDPYAKSDAAFAEAQAARHKARARDKQNAWDKAVKSVSTWTPSSAVEAMTAMPSTLQQMYLLAEESTLNRSEVLRFFPAVAPTTREAWTGFATPAAPKKAATPKQRKTA